MQQLVVMTMAVMMVTAVLELIVLPGKEPVVDRTRGVHSGERVTQFNLLVIVLKIVRLPVVVIIVGIIVLKVIVVTAEAGQAVHADTEPAVVAGGIEKILGAVILGVVMKRANVYMIAHVFGRYSYGVKK